jgi:hypothetical protein
MCLVSLVTVMWACSDHADSTARGRVRTLGQISVGPNVLVSGDRPGAAHAEYFADADPADSSRLAVCSMVIDPPTSRLSAAVYVSRDRGTTWVLSLDDSLTRYGDTWDPACAYGPGGILHFANLPASGDPRVKREESTRFFRSLDGGKTWEKPVIAPFLDNEDFGIDWTDGPTRGRIYAAGVRVIEKPGTTPKRHFSLLYSADSGRTYKGPIDKVLPDSLYQGSVSAPIVLNDGRVLVPVEISKRDAVFGETKKGDTTAKHHVAVVPVVDGGTKIGEPVRVARFENCPGYIGGPPMLAVDRTSGPFRNRLYFVFADGSYGRCQIMLSWSDDAVKWSTPLGVDDPRVPLDSGKGPDAFFPQVTVNRNGVVGITWYDRREDSENLAFRQRFTASLDGGESVVPSIAVSTAAHEYARGGAREGYFGLASGVRSKGSTWLAVVTGGAYRTYDQVGDYGGMMVGPDGVFHPVWVDNRDGVPHLYTAAVSVRGVAKRSADWDAGLGKNVSDSVSYLATVSTFSPKDCSMSLTLDLLNRSKTPMALPFTIKVKRMMSHLGVPRVDSSASDELGRPVWSTGGAGALAPDSVISFSTRVILDDCVALGGKAPFRWKTDARMSGTPIAGFAGPKMFAMETVIFEARK